MTVRLVYDVPGFEQWELDWLRFLLADFDVQLILDPEHRFVGDNVVLAASCSSPSQADTLRQHLKAFKSRGLKVGLFHLSDEYGATPVDFYADADFVFRNYYRRAALRRGNWSYFAIGYKSGFAQFLTHKPLAQRRYLWSFAGQLKSSRTAMLKHAENIPRGYHHLTSKWEDPRALDTAQYAALLNDTVFALCPRGNVSVDCFRVYEALEAGAIPIVEDSSTVGSVLDMMRPAAMGLIPSIHPSEHWHNLKTHGFTSYWIAAYGPEFPCPRLNHWQDLPTLIERLNTEETGRKIQHWWQAYKSNLARNVFNLVHQTWPLKSLPSGGTPSDEAPSEGWSKLAV